MNAEDILYVICLLGCICAGHFVRKMKNEEQRKLFCTGFGVLLVFLVSGWHIIHCFVSVTMGWAVLVFVHPSVCHLVSFVTMFAYLAFFRMVDMFGLPQPSGHSNMIQMVLTLKVAGMAFEKTAAWKRIDMREQQIKYRRDEAEGNTLGEDVLRKPLTDLSEYDVELQNAGFWDLFSYTFNYIGVLTGPYYRFRTYQDYFDYPFKYHAPCEEVTMMKFNYAVLYSFLYVMANFYWPIEYALSDEFYEERSAFYRLMYVWPSFFIFRMRMYTGLTLSECVCTLAGFGAYPDDAAVKNGEGPSGEYDHLKRDAHRRRYNFTTIINTRVQDVESCWTFRESMKHWNICVQYWLAVNVYKLFPSKRFRTVVTLLCSAFWHGFRAGHYFCIMGAPFCVAVEDIWQKLIRRDASGIKRLGIDVLFWFMKSFALSYLGTAFLLVSFSDIWRYYGSIYHIGYITWLALLLSGLVLTKMCRSH